VGAGTDTLYLPTAGIITFSNLPGMATTITSGNSHSIAGLAGGNSSSEIYVAGAHLDLDLNGPSTCDAVVVTGGNVALAGDLAGTTPATNLTALHWDRVMADGVLGNGVWIVPPGGATNGQRFYRLQIP
jgi:hypothetical protein